MIDINELKEWLAKEIRVRETLIRMYSEYENKERVFFHGTRDDVFTCCLNKIKELEGK